MSEARLEYPLIITKGFVKEKRKYLDTFKDRQTLFRTIAVGIRTTTVNSTMTTIRESRNL